MKTRDLIKKLEKQGLHLTDTAQGMMYTKEERIQKKCQDTVRQMK